MDTDHILVYIIAIIIPSIMWRLIVIPTEIQKSTRTGAGVILGMAILLGIYGFMTEFLNAESTSSRIVDGIWLIIVAVTLLPNLLAWRTNRMKSLSQAKDN
jgi:nitrate reductase gamma subunit